MQAEARLFPFPVQPAMQHMSAVQRVLYTQFQEEHCPKLEAPPYVCNRCREANQCTLKKKFYAYDAADRDCRNLLVESRRGVNITEKERLFLSEQIHCGIQRGQSVHHILETEKDQFTIGEKTLLSGKSFGL